MGSAITAKFSTCRRSVTGVRKYGHDLAEQDPHFLGGFAEYCYILPGTWILRLPDELSDEEATPLNCGVATMASVTEAAEIALGDAVVIQGLGLLGLYGAAMAKARGARCVIGLDAVASRLEAAKKFGADHVIDVGRLGEKSLIDQVRKLCRPDGADAVIEVCGVPDVIPQGLQMLRTGGRYVLGGLVNPDANVTIDANMLVKRWVTMRGIHNYHPRHLDPGARFRDDEPRAVSVQGNRRFQICPEGSGRRLQEGLRAHRAARCDRSGAQSVEHAISSA